MPRGVEQLEKMATIKTSKKTDVICDAARR